MGKTKHYMYIFFLLAWTPIGVTAQQTATFDAFRGTVYYIPGEYLKQGYGDYIAYCEIMGHTTFQN